MTRLEAKVEHEKLMLSTLPELSLLILNLARDQGQIAINDVVTASKANRNTVKVHLRKLVEMGRLTKHGAGRGVWYQSA